MFVEANGHMFTDNLSATPLPRDDRVPLGVAAALLTENGRIGYIGAFPSATAYNDVNGLLLGAGLGEPRRDGRDRARQHLLRPAEGGAGRRRLSATVSNCSSA